MFQAILQTLPKHVIYVILVINEVEVTYEHRYYTMGFRFLLEFKK
jgi:hypothetical protein